MRAPIPRRLALVGCGKQKLTRAAPARELYTGPLFRAALAAAEAEFGADVWILSAKHGLTDLDEKVEPYDLALDDVPAEQRGASARDVIRNLTDDDHDSPAYLTVYAGESYVHALRAVARRLEAHGPPGGAQPGPPPRVAEEPPRAALLRALHLKPSHLFGGARGPCLSGVFHVQPRRPPHP